MKQRSTLHGYLKKVLVIAIFLPIVVPILWVFVLKWVNPPITYLQIRERGSCPSGVSFDKENMWLSDIAPALPLAVVSSEDQNFMKHAGLDFGAIAKAKEYNQKQSKKTRGASTISQQVAKNVFLWPNRSFIRKAAEVYFTSLIELMWSKDRIMEVYLNVIETGPCCFGAEAAAKRYFKIPASKLTRQQCALLTACIPSPRKSNPAKPTAYLLNRQQHILNQMRHLGDDYFERYRKTIRFRQQPEPTKSKKGKKSK
jgi:monofunctional glycosyltransferase